MAQFEQDTIQSRLIADGTGKPGGAKLLVEDREILQPGLPGHVQMPFDTDSVVHALVCPISCFYELFLSVFAKLVILKGELLGITRLPGCARAIPVFRSSHAV